MVNTDTDTDSNSDADTILEMLGNDIEHSVYIAEYAANMFTEKINHKYYVGIVADDSTEGTILDIAVSPKSFFIFSASAIQAYLHAYSTHEYARKHIDIMQLIVIDGIYSVVVKTTWLKTIQRKWRSIRQSRIL